ncbi:PAS domain S-box protein [Candidatus Magnetominusculus xianensis]|uniref:PAS domain S-box protein n=1 Tax=Candidatus Magnetominusculus xianensis TaxID=1748249 RepID=UPI0012EDE5A5|nr:PAS domain S-box protein [Candidatus Magnetominusculus xianensis]MBF0402755.1 PAS domain S-box protein [Nitrospirota bacterium]
METKYRILVIDDEQVVHDVISKHLGKKGYDVHHAFNGEEGLLVCTSVQPSVILLDLKMPVMNGLEFLDKFREQFSFPCSIIAVTGHAGDVDFEKCFKNGIMSFLHKPFSLYELIGVIDSSINLQRTQHSLLKELSERKSVEEKHLQLLDDFEAIFENAPFGIAYLDCEFNIIKMNRFLYNITGFQPKDIVGKPCYETVGEYAADNAKGGMEKVCSFCKVAESLMTGEPTAVERPMGKNFLKLTTIPLFDKDKSISHFLEVIEDITWQKEAEGKIVRHYQIQGTINSILQISIEPIPLKDVLQQVLELVLSIPRFSFQSKGSIHLVDDTTHTLVLCAHHNYSEPLLTICDVIPFGRCLCGLAASTGEIIHAETVDERHTIRYDTMAPHGHYCIPIVHNNKVLGVFNMYITEGHKRSSEEEEFLSAIANTISGVIVRNQRNAEIREREEHFRSVVESTKNAIITINSSGNITFWNKAAENMFGYTFDEIRSAPVAKIIPERFRKGHIEGMDRVLKTGEARVIGEMIELFGLRKDGSEFPIEFSVARWKASTGIYFTAVLVDITKRKQAEETLAESFENLRKALGGVIQTLSMALEAKDPYTAGHQNRVADLSRAIAIEMGLSHHQIEGIRMAGAIHDVGKIWVPSEILSKPGKLHESEFMLIKNHSFVGYEILSTVEFPWPIDKIVLQHHEKLDGSGYPQGLKGEEILIEARIICVADIVEAMSSHRPYRPSLGMDIALEEIVSNKGILYDIYVVDACLRLFKEKGFTFKDSPKYNQSPRQNKYDTKANTNKLNNAVNIKA